MHLARDPIRHLPTPWLAALCGAAATLVFALPWITGAAPSAEWSCRQAASAPAATAVRP